MKKRYQIFISSTFADLEEERESVMRAILNVDCFPAGMELFPASNKSQFEYIKGIIDNSDYYVLIIAGRYGTEDVDGIGFTEKEYDYAREIGVPVYTFIYDNIDNIPIGKTDKDANKFEKLKRFIKKAQVDRVCNYWGNKDELRSLVETSLRKAFEDEPRTGWVRGDLTITEHIQDNNPRKIKKPETVKDKVLLEIYNEYCKDISDMKNNISENKLNLDKDVFIAALEKLNSESLIKDVNFVNGGGKVLMVFTDNLKITTYGISYLEKKFYI
ncbi:YjcQ family protein [Clostridium sp.]|uniref:YjcQ family protein n=1 Tax=Clostridium sp. TaxID=1506 RepID=UPI001E13CC21|nr:YjcQ family protein [Clostridium sp.]MBS5306459.1 DUF4062 domain-containing protein [Clostridium sp.]